MRCGRKKAILAEREKLPLHILYSTPRWLVEKWTAQFGPEAARKLLQWNNTTPRLYVRANSLIPLNDPRRPRLSAALPAGSPWKASCR